MRDTESQSEEERRRREEAEAHSNANSMAYQVERQLRELGDRAPVNEGARAEHLILEIRELIRTQPGDFAKLRQLTSDLQQAGVDLSSRAYSQATSAGAQVDNTNNTQSAGADEVIDANLKKT